jgi:xanthine dehydrogenase accessory factor
LRKLNRMRPDLLLLAAELAGRGEAFVLATVVRRVAPSSARVGDTALVTQDGEFHGWLGGSCTQPSVVREALRALADGAPRLVALAPQPQAEPREGVTALPNTCYSGGSVDVYIEPVLPAPHLVVFGSSPVAQALVRLGKAMKFYVDVVDPDIDHAAVPDADRVLAALDPVKSSTRKSPEMLAVVATMGQRDEEATAAALALEAAYLGVVASRRRYAQLRGALIARGVTPQALSRIASPTGLDIGAHTPEEIAVSILAQIVQVRRGAATTARAAEQAAVEQASEARDPVCGMTVKTAGARHQHVHADRTYYFCCGGCRERFMSDPNRYIAAAGRAASV